MSHTPASTEVHPGADGVGSAIAQAAYGLAARAAAEMLTAGTCESCAGGVDYAEMNSRISGQSRTK